MSPPAPRLAPTGSCHRPGVALLALVGLAIALRLFALTRFGGNLAADPDAYRAIAGNLAAGRGFGFPAGSVLGNPTAYRPPLYPCLLALIISGTGGEEQAVRFGIAALHVVLGAGTVLFTGLAARRLGLGRGSLLAAFLVAVDPLLIHNATLVMTETLAAFLVSLLVWSSLRSRSGGGRFATGVAFGMCCLCRPTFWAFGAGVAVVWGCVASRRSLKGGAESSTADPALWRSLVPLVCGVAFTVSPWVIRNAISMGSPILTTTHGGYTLLLGHNPLYTREVVDKPWGAVWDVDADSRWVDWLDAGMRTADPPLVSTQEPTPAVEMARDRWMNRRAWEYMRAEPLTALRSSLTLAGRFWNIVPLQTTNRTLPESLRWLIGTFYAVSFLAILAGLVRLDRHAWSRWWPLVLLIVSFSAVHTLYWSDMRMRAPLVPVLALLATRGVVRTGSGESARGGGG